MKSAFDDEKGYELTALGRQFVHYAMNEITPKLEYQRDTYDAEHTHETGEVVDA